MSQFSVPCSVYRGGTSRGLFFREEDLPASVAMRHAIFLAGIDAYNPSQVNGLGGGASHTSKVIVVGTPTVPDACLDYTFYQIGIGEAIVDGEGTCGNLMAAVGAFAVDEKYVSVNKEDVSVEVIAFNKNIGKIIRMDVPVKNGEMQTVGDYAMPGLVLPGAKISVAIVSPGGGKTGKTLPLGKTMKVETEKAVYEATFTDVVNPFVYVYAADFDLKGSEPNSELSNDKALIEELDRIRVSCAVRAGMSETVEEAKRTPSIPKIAMVSSPHEYITSSGATIRAEEVDVVAKMISMNRFHRTFAGSGLYSLGALALIAGTIPGECFANGYGGVNRRVRIGHPDGIAEVMISLTKDGEDVESVGMERTARRIMKGELFIPESL